MQRTLADTAVGETVIIDAMLADIPEALERRILERGLIPGISAKVLRKAPLGDPMELQVGDGLISVRHHEAGYIATADDTAPFKERVQPSTPKTSLHFSPIASDPQGSVLLVGPPNVGKSTIFNALTSGNAQVGNYAGVTVALETAPCTIGTQSISLIDLPGTHSLVSDSPDEAIAIQTLTQSRPSLVLAVISASDLKRGLYLVSQLLDLGLPMMLVVNMHDEVAPRTIDTDALSKHIGTPCIAIQASRLSDINGLKTLLEQAFSERLSSEVRCVVPKEVEPLFEKDSTASAFYHWLAKPSDEKEHRKLKLDAIQSRFDWADSVSKQCWHDGNRTAAPNEDSLEKPQSDRNWLSNTEKWDAVLLHPVMGLAVFVILMTVLFQLLFVGADPLVGVLENGIGWMQTIAMRTIPAGIVQEFIIHGMIGGVGNVVVFLPQIALLFLLLSLMEDTGYLARVAYLVDRVMRSMGLNGRAFVPMLSGYACAIPAILATRTLERRRDRLLTMMVIPLMSCSARLPVYSLLIGTLFPVGYALGWMPVQGLLLLAIYIFSTGIALVAGWIFSKTMLRTSRLPLLLDLPPYRRPTLPVMTRKVLRRSGEFLKEAGTVILVFTCIQWALLSFPKISSPAEVPEAVAQQQALELSYGGRLGKAIEPVIAPLGFDWKIGVGLIGAFAAREVFVSTMGIIYGVGEVEDETTSLRHQMMSDTKKNGQPVYSIPVALSLMVFIAISCQCMSTLAVIKKETQSWFWPGFVFVYMSVLAWLLSFATFQISRLLL